MSAKLKTYAAMLRQPSAFTVRELVRSAGLPEATVQTVLHRTPPDWLSQRSKPSKGARGRAPLIHALTEAGRLSLIEQLGTLQFESRVPVQAADEEPLGLQAARTLASRFESIYSQPNSDEEFLRRLLSEGGAQEHLEAREALLQQVKGNLQWAERDAARLPEPRRAALQAEIDQLRAWADDAGGDSIIQEEMLPAAPESDINFDILLYDNKEMPEVSAVTHEDDAPSWQEAEESLLAAVLGRRVLVESTPGNMPRALGLVAAVRALLASKGVVNIATDVSEIATAEVLSKCNVLLVPFDSDEDHFDVKRLVSTVDALKRKHMPVLMADCAYRQSLSRTATEVGVSYVGGLEGLVAQFAEQLVRPARATRAKAADGSAEAMWAAMVRSQQKDTAR